MEYRVVFSDGVCGDWSTDRAFEEECVEWYNTCTELEAHLEVREVK